MTNHATRTAGLLYLVVVVTGLFTLGFVPSRLIVGGDIARTVELLSQHEFLWRLGIVSGYLCYTAFLVLPLELYRVLHHVHRRAAVLMIAFAVMSVPIAFLNQVHLLEILSLIGNPLLTPDAIGAGVAAELSTYQNGQLMAQIFWGLWLWPFGLLVYRSEFLPRALGAMLMVGCVGYVMHFVATLLVPAYLEWGVAAWIRMPAGLGEMGIAVWMAVFGKRGTQSPA